MYDHACRNIDTWMSSGEWTNGWGEVPSISTRIHPPRGYSQRAAHLADLRAKYEWAATHADEQIRAPSNEAQSSAKTFIQSLPDACLTFRLAISQDGEINFFFGGGSDLFQVMIDASGMVSYYMSSDAGEDGGSDIPADQFQYLKILAFVDRNK